MFALFKIIAVFSVLAYLIRRFRNWLRTVHCPKCGKWFCLNYHSFVATDQVVSQNSTNFGGGSHAGWQGGDFWQMGRTNADPFIREWGEARYICRACGRRVALRNVKRDR